MEIKEKLDKLVMFLANEKYIPLDAAKRNRDAIVEQTIKNLKKELKEFDFNAENWKYSFGFNEGGCLHLTKLYKVNHFKNLI